MFKEIKRCRLCSNTNLEFILSLGPQAITSVFPKRLDHKAELVDLELVKCHGRSDKESCGLLQLRYSCNLSNLYTQTYGYRSGLNSIIENHLKDIACCAVDMAGPRKGDVIIDIGSNDATLLKYYPRKAFRLIGIDPLAKKFSAFYPKEIECINDFFPSKRLASRVGKRKARIITSAAVLYDCQDPVSFAREVHRLLDKDGIWLLEQSYMPGMLKLNSYDTICHEHLAYYGLRQLKWLLDKTGFKILDINLNDINGSSLFIVASKKISSAKENRRKIKTIMHNEALSGLDSIRPYEDFRRRIYRQRDKLLEIIDSIDSKKQKIIGLGASTKGNVILQFCRLGPRDIPYIAEINPDKFGSLTPGSNIPIISEETASRIKPDFLLALPWHLEKGLQHKRAYICRPGGKLILPLPRVHFA